MRAELLLLLLAPVLAFAATLPGIEKGQARHEHRHDSPTGTSDHDHVNIPTSAPTSLPAAADQEEVDQPHHHHHVPPTTYVKWKPSDSPPPSGHHHHNSHAPAKVILNDTEIHYWHSFPPSYLTADFRLDEDSAIFGEEFPEDWVPDQAGGHGALMVLHVIGMCLAYFGALPITLALRAASHPLHFLANLVFLALALTGWIFGRIYTLVTPDRYTGEVHSGMGNLLLLLSIGLAALDATGLMQRMVSWSRSGRPGTRSWRSFTSAVLSGGELQSEYRLAGDGTVRRAGDVSGGYRDEAAPLRETVFAIGDDEEEQDKQDEPTNPYSPVPLQTTPNRLSSTGSRSSSASDGTLQDAYDTMPGHDERSSTSRSPTSARFKPSVHIGAYDQVDHRSPAGPGDLIMESRSGRDIQPSRTPFTAQRIGEAALTCIRRIQLIIAYVTLITGISVYTGMCRDTYIPSCAAHYIKGSIFYLYGVFIFARYLGACADLGWAWNLAPAGYSGPNAEMIECGLIFTYGITNTWMERLGSQKGDPYTVKQVQHISIAIMFWFAGLSGMFLESKRIRRLLGAVVYGRDRNALEPPSYAFSFNPLPAIVIAVTGLAMSAHHQDYLFQVQIHSLWGYLLTLGSIARCLTYFFLWLRPPTDSHLPSRPPTEVLTAFGLATGGLVFMLSNEEIAYAAMRAGYDDMMAFLNFSVALIGIVFCWAVVIMGVKGWGVMRMLGKGSAGEAFEMRASGGEIRRAPQA